MIFPAAAGVNMGRRNQIFILGIILFSAVACAKSPIQRAVGGQLLPSESNIVVTNHCQGCHLHSNFNGEAHLASIRVRYPEGSPLRQADNCFQCHSLKLENIFRSEVRTTQRPHGNLVEMANVPKPGEPKRNTAKKVEGKEKVLKKADKKRRWYFFYLF